MRPSILLLALSITGAHASWFSGSDSTPQYSSWSTPELKKWLVEHNLYNPSFDNYNQAQLQDVVKSNWDTVSTWTAEQYASAQKAFADVRDSSFDAWDESRLREFLLEQGVVAPSGPREKLVLMAQSRYRAYNSAASSMSAQASTAVYGNAAHQATQSASSIANEATNSIQSVAAQATATATRAFDDSKDYVYSTWDDNKLRSYLEQKGVIKTKTQKTRDEYLALMRDTYAKTTNPAYEAWSDSYIHQWLVDRGLIKSDFEQKRESLMSTIAKYYYDITDTVYSGWSESDTRAWLIEHDIIKSDAQIKRDKLAKLVGDNYANAKSTIWSSWSDSQMRDWLIENGYLRTDAQVKRDELIKLMDSKYKDAHAKAAPYLVWPDARLRAYLRQNGVSEAALPTGRPSLLQEVRIRWVQSNNYAESVFAQIREIVNGGVEAAEVKLSQLVEILTGAKDDAGAKAKKGKHYADEKVAEGRNAAGDKVKYGGEKIKGEL